MTQSKRLGEKYKTQYLKTGKNKEYKTNINGILEKEKEFNKDCVDWNVEEIEKYLKDLKSVSTNTLSMVYGVYKNFVEFISDKEGLPIIEQKIEHGRMCELIDYDGLTSTLISPEQYRYVVNKLTRNVRDKVIMELAWEGLTPDEIRNLEENDIKFVESSETGLEVAMVKISDEKIFKVQDVRTVEDIKKCKNEIYYYVESLDGKSKHHTFKPSNYLIKPVQIGKGKKEDYLTNPSITLQNAIKQQQITCADIDVTKLTIENIRRSKIIYMLAPQNEKYFSKDYIKMIFDMDGSDSTLFWYQKVSKIKYA